MAVSRHTGLAVCPQWVGGVVEASNSGTKRTNRCWAMTRSDAVVIRTPNGPEDYGGEGALSPCGSLPLQTLVASTA